MAVCGICLEPQGADLFRVDHEGDSLDSEVEHLFHRTCLNNYYVRAPFEIIGKCPFDKKNIVGFNEKEDLEFFTTLKIIASAKEKNVNELRLLLNKNSVSEKIRALSIFAAMHLQNIEPIPQAAVVCVRELLETGPISEIDRTEIVRKAAMHGSLQIVYLALENGSISARGYIEAYLTAKTHKIGDWERVAALLDRKIKSRLLFPGISAIGAGLLIYSWFYKTNP